MTCADSSYLLAGFADCPSTPILHQGGKQSVEWMRGSAAVLAHPMLSADDEVIMMMRCRNHH